MSKKNREIEAKFYVPELLAIRDHLVISGARITAERIFERNWRFDTPDRRFEKSGEVLRVRQDEKSYLTYKRPTDTPEDRVEIDIEVADSERTTDLLLALGFEVITIYEKNRETFAFEDCFVFLDELPFGNFIEVEGESIKVIRSTAKTLGLNWENRLRKNYVEIFHELIQHLSLPFSDATFHNFTQMSPITEQDIKLPSGID